MTNWRTGTRVYVAPRAQNFRTVRTAVENADWLKDIRAQTYEAREQARAKATDWAAEARRWAEESRRWAREAEDWAQRRAEHARRAAESSRRAADTRAFDELGVPPSATLAEVKRAYRTRMKTAHPDRGGTEAEAKRVNAAFAVLRTRLLP